MGDGYNLVLLALQSRFDLGELWPAAYGARELVYICAVGSEAIGETVAKVAGTKNENIVPGFGQVGRDKVPAKSSGARDDKWLRRWRRGLEQFS